MASTICAGVDAPSPTTYATQRGTIFLLPEESATLILEPLLFTVNSSYTSPRCIDSRHLKSIANSQPRATPVAMDDDGEPLVPQPNARFPRFLELPPELQIQIWEHAIKDTIPGTRDPRFGVELYYTGRSRYTTHSCPTSGRKIRYWYVQRWSNVVLSCSLARQVAEEWWRWITNGWEEED